MNWYLLEGINPEPWVSPNVTSGRKDGKQYLQVYTAEKLRVFQAAVKEEMAQHYVELQAVASEVSFCFYFWRRLEGKDRAADVTNLQKSLEDALQQVLFHNDQQVIHSESWLMDQGPDVEPCIAIEFAPTVHRPLHVNDVVKSLRTERQKEVGWSPAKLRPPVDDVF